MSELTRKGLVAREYCLMFVFAMFVSLTLAHFVHDRWFFLASQQAVAVSTTHSNAITQSPAYAPNAYRIAMPFVGKLLTSTFHLSGPGAAAIVDGLCCVFSLLLLCATLLRGIDDVGQRIPRVVLICCFFALVQLPLNWVVPWQRPETMASALFMAATLFCVAQHRRLGHGSIMVLIACLTLWQAFVRSDIGISFGIGVLFAAMLERYRHRADSTWKRGLLVSLVIISISAAVQAYLQFILFPHLSYPPDTPKYQALVNLRFGHNREILALAILPMLTFLSYGKLTGVHYTDVDRVVFFTALVHFVFWFALGSTAEVRIFVPSLLLLCVPAARAAVWILLGPCLKLTVSQRS